MPKIRLELIFYHDLRYLDFCDSIHGEDIVCQIVGDTLITESGDGDKITLSEFCDRVEAVIQRQADERERGKL